AFQVRQVLLVDGPEHLAAEVGAQPQWQTGARVVSSREAPVLVRGGLVQGRPPALAAHRLRPTGRDGPAPGQEPVALAAGDLHPDLDAFDAALDVRAAAAAVGAGETAVPQERALVAEGA